MLRRCFVLCTLALSALAGAVPQGQAGPATPLSAPTHLAQQRTLKVNSDLACARVLPLLLENGYLVRSVNEHLGLIAFSRQRADPFRGGGLMNVTVEGSLLFQPSGRDSIRALLLLSRRLEKSSANGTNLEVELQLTATQDEYTKVWSILDEALATQAPNN